MIKELFPKITKGRPRIEAPAVSIRKSIATGFLKNETISYRISWRTCALQRILKMIFVRLCKLIFKRCNNDRLLRRIIRYFNSLHSVRSHQHSSRFRVIINMLSIGQRMGNDWLLYFVDGRKIRSATTSRAIPRLSRAWS